MHASILVFFFAFLNDTKNRWPCDPDCIFMKPFVDFVAARRTVFHKHIFFVYTFSKVSDDWSCLAFNVTFTDNVDMLPETARF